MHKFRLPESVFSCYDFKRSSHFHVENSKASKFTNPMAEICFHMHSFTLSRLMICFVTPLN